MPEAPPGGRIVTLDIVRGVAVLGIFAMNVVSFAMPGEAHYNPLAYGMDGPADLATWFATFIVFDGKMRGLFTFLFGASLLLVIRGAEARREEPARVHYARMFWLLVLGGLHFVLLWEGDILVDLALIGCVAFAFRDMASRKLLVWSGLLLLLQCMMMAALAAQFVSLQAAAEAPGARAAAIEAWRVVSGGFAPPDAPELAGDAALYRGSYGALVANRVARVLGDATGAFLQGGAETLATMLAGMWALQSGFLTGAWRRAAYVRVALVGLGLGLSGYAAMAAHLHASGYKVSLIFAYAIGAATVVRPVAFVGIAALVILATRGGGAFSGRLAAAGRTAFSNYILTGIVATTVFYGYGAGLYGRLSRWELYPLVFAVWAAMLLWSKPWLARYRYGPFEWLWRSLSRGEAQPMRR